MAPETVQDRYSTAQQVCAPPRMRYHFLKSSLRYRVMISAPDESERERGRRGESGEDFQTLKQDGMTEDLSDFLIFD